MPVLSLDQLLATAKPRRKEIGVGDNGSRVWLQEPNALDLQELRHRFGPKADISTIEFKAHILRLSLIHEDGTRVFTPEKESGLSPEEAASRADEQVRTLMGMSWGVFNRLAAAAWELSGIGSVVTPEGEEKN